MRMTMEKLGYIAFGIVAGALLRGIYDQELRRARAVARLKSPAVAAVRG